MLSDKGAQTKFNKSNWQHEDQITIMKEGNCKCARPIDKGGQIHWRGRWFEPRGDTPKQDGGNEWQGVGAGSAGWHYY